MTEKLFLRVPSDKVSSCMNELLGRSKALQ